MKVGEEEIQLAPKEFDLLWELLDHKGLVLTRDQLLEQAGQVGAVAHVGRVEQAGRRFQAALVAAAIGGQPVREMGR